MPRLHKTPTPQLSLTVAHQVFRRRLDSLTFGRTDGHSDDAAPLAPQTHTPLFAPTIREKGRIGLSCNLRTNPVILLFNRLIEFDSRLHSLRPWHPHQVSAAAPMAKGSTSAGRSVCGGIFPRGPNSQQRNLSPDDEVSNERNSRPSSLVGDRYLYLATVHDRLA